MFVLTIDQQRSRSEPDRIPALRELLADVPVLRAFERTAGDEVQGVLDDAGAVVEVALRLARTQQWSTGVGAGPVREPLPPSTREGSGPAFELAREAVQRAKGSSTHLAVRGADPPAARDAEAVLRLLAELVARRTPAGWQVADLLARGASQAEVAERLGVSRQAVSQRAAAAALAREREVRPVAAALLAAAQGPA
jgi:hypothetical protein